MKRKTQRDREIEKRERQYERRKVKGGGVKREKESEREEKSFYKIFKEITDK